MLMALLLPDPEDQPIIGVTINGIACVVFVHKTTEGWEALLSGMIRGGWTITGSWPIATEMATRLNARENASLSKAVFDRITFDSRILGGRACIRGMRIPVSVIVGQIAHGATWDEVLQGYSDLERDDIQQALEYAACLTQEQVQTA